MSGIKSKQEISIGILKTWMRNNKIIRSFVQRPLDSERALKISKSMEGDLKNDKFIMPPLFVVDSKSDGVYDIIDGMHRLHALIQVDGFDDTMVDLYTLYSNSKADVIHSFVRLNTSVPVPMIYMLPEEQKRIVTRVIQWMRETYGDDILKSNVQGNRHPGNGTVCIRQIRENLGKFIHDMHCGKISDSKLVLNSVEDVIEMVRSLNSIIENKLSDDLCLYEDICSFNVTHTIKNYRRKSRAKYQSCVANIDKKCKGYDEKCYIGLIHPDALTYAFIHMRDI